MIEQFAYYYDGKNSEQKKIKIQYNNLENLLILNIDKNKKSVPANKIVLLPRIGTSPYKLQFPEGDMCEIISNSLSDSFIKSLHIEMKEKIIHKIESSLKLVIFFTFLTIILGYGIVQYGIPYTVKHIAKVIPLNSNNLFAENIVEILDETVFSKSDLKESKKNQYKQLLNNIIYINNLDDKYNFNLIFRQGNDIGANALALPSGTIIVTDELINIVSNDKELESILAHEVGHIVERHSLRQIIQTGLFGVIITIIIGDTSYISTIASSIPVFLTEKHYSRNFELEADLYAYRYLKKSNIPTVHFANILKRFSDNKKNISLFSSHPITKERIKIFIKD